MTAFLTLLISIPPNMMDHPSEDYGQIPYCVACNTAEHLAFEDFVPNRIMPDGQKRPGTVSYLCTGCNQYNSHAVPASWQPPAWHWYV